MRDKKKIVIGVLCALVGIMAVGYAALATRLNITGTSSIDSTWRVEITNITEGNVVGDATSKETPSYTATTANFNVGLIQPGDSITYDIEVSNLGTLKAKVDSIQVVMDENDAINYTTSGLEEGATLGVNEKDTLSITVSYNPEVTSQPTNIAKDITVTINYVQDLETNSESGEPSTGYDYVVGDQVTFAGSNWYVIKNSTAEEDYVTLLKEAVLTNEELGDYAANETITCVDWMVDEGTYGCTTIGETKIATSVDMSYYWSDTCHLSNRYGYTDEEWSGCEGHNDYEGSKVREFLEETYINALGADNLKEVDEYKIRLVTSDELLGDLGYSMDVTSSGLGESPLTTENVPKWVYKLSSGFAMDDYWTMFPYVSGTRKVYSVRSGQVMGEDVLNTSAIRPVINLLKSSIQ